MAHYALLDSDGIVTQVFTGRDENDLADGVDDWEAYYGNVHGQTCLRTSYNTVGNQHAFGGTPFRGNYAGVGYRYDETLDAFIPPQPFPSWMLDQSTFQWSSPVTYPDDGATYEWDEEAGSWAEVTISE